jgi:hypothetical protein
MGGSKRGPEPNRLAGQVEPGAFGDLNASSARHRGRQSVDASAERGRWSTRRIATTASIGELLIVGASAALIGSASTGAIAVVGWLVANALLGIGLAVRGGGRRTWGPALAGVCLAGLVAGVVAAGAIVLTILPSPADASGPALVAVAVTILVLIFGLPVVAVGLVGASVAIDARTELRHRGVASGETPFRQPSGELEKRSRASTPLDDLGVAKATADGAATTVIREYPLDASPDALLAADAVRLAAIGYSLDSVVRHPGKTGIGWRLLGIVVLLVDLAMFFSASPIPWTDAFHDARRGRLVATFQLRSRTHAPVAIDGHDG